MYLTKILIGVVTIGVISTACKSTKKNVSSTSQPVITNTPVTTNNAPVAEPSPSPYAKPAAVTYTTGARELTALRNYYKEATMQELSDGEAIYTQGNCIKCHAPFDIYKISAAAWKTILPDMAQRAYISESNRESVNKYFIAIKALQPK